jgi:hypothetical protein
MRSKTIERGTRNSKYILERELKRAKQVGRIINCIEYLPKLRCCGKSYQQERKLKCGEGPARSHRRMSYNKVRIRIR